MLAALGLSKVMAGILGTLLLGLAVTGWMLKGAWEDTAKAEAALQTAVAVNRENERVIADQHRYHEFEKGQLAGALSDARARAARYQPARREIDRAKPDEIRELGPAALRVLERLRGDGNGGAVPGSAPAAAGR